MTIDIIKNGPYIVKGEVEMKDTDGNSYPVEKRMALCRCALRQKSRFATGSALDFGEDAA